MRQMLEEEPSIEISTSKNDFFDPIDYYPLQYTNNDKRTNQLSINLNALVN